MARLLCQDGAFGTKNFLPQKNSKTNSALCLQGFNDF
jgi:hypothetical protein